MQHSLTTATPFKSQKILLKPEYSTRFKFNPQEIKYILAPNIRSTLPSYMIYFISLQSSHPFMGSPQASRGSAIHVFLVIIIMTECDPPGRFLNPYLSVRDGFEV